MFNDLRYGLRMLLKHKGFTFIASLTLALGIGANAAIFSVVNAVLLRPLPFRESERLVMVWNRADAAAGGDRTPLAVAELLDWRAQSRVFESVSAFQPRFFNYVGSELPERVLGAGVTTNLFATLGVEPVLGRPFRPEEERPGTPRVALISDVFWRKHFAADPQVIGRALNLNGESFTIVGVMPATVNFPARETEIWTALQVEQPARWGPWFLIGVGRLKPGVTLQQANADVRTMKIGLGGGKNFNFNLLPVNDYIVGNVRPALVALLVAVTLVLLIAAANVANLTLLRATARNKEISIRIALGANRRRIIRQLLTESLLLSVAGGVLGVLGARWGVDVLRSLAPQDIPRLEQISLDGLVLGWTALVTLLTGVIFGLAPVWQSSRLNLNEALKEGGRSATEGAGRKRGRNVLVVVEMALAVVLLVGAGLLVKSLWRLQQVDLGINTERVLTMQFFLRGQRYSQPPQARDFSARLLEQIQALPGVQAAAVSNSLPPDLTAESDDFTIEGRSYVEHEEPVAYLVRVSPDYFRALGVRLASGRYFTAADTADAPQVILINETMQRRFFPDENPLGKRLNLGTAREPDWEQIVGVVGDVKYNGVADEVQPAIYLSVAQAPDWGPSLIVKTDAADPLSLATPLRSVIKSLDPELPIARMSTMEQRLATATSQPRFRTLLIALFAVLALVLACIGIYGVMSYSVVQRAHELGIRMALGAQTHDVLKLVLGQGLRLALIGTTIGLATAFGLTRLMRTLLFGVSPTDALTFSAIAALLLLMALLACYVPARRATKVDPLEVLHHD
jgi:putative ABC transport system permease protein